MPTVSWPWVVADVVVAGNRVRWHGQPVELPAGIMQVANVMRPVEGDIAEVNDNVGAFAPT